MKSLAKIGAVTSCSAIESTCSLSSNSAQPCGPPPSSDNDKRQTDQQSNRKGKSDAVNEEHRQPKSNVRRANAKLVRDDLVTNIDHGAYDGDGATTEPKLSRERMRDHR